MLKIGEFSRLTQVSVRMLRYYDENGLLKPALVDKFTGYRMYTAEQIPVLHRIVFLRDAGFSVAEIAEALSDWHDANIAAVLQAKAREIEQAIDAQRQVLARIDTALADIDRQQVAFNCNVVIKSIPGFTALSLRRVIPSYWHEDLLWEELYHYIETRKIMLAKDSLNLAIYHDPDFRDADVDVEICVKVAKTGVGTDIFSYREIAATPYMASMLVYGPYENIAIGFNAFADWLNRHQQYRMTGETRQICHRGPWNENKPVDYVTEIQIVVQKTLDSDTV